ncbi:MAG: YbaB/EbfC family nucleoid-associated protein [Oscillospiraceae bacterium]|nr:YbaB/EbfC family nucleoid-associated protein [Oscillospiraceae bacterium]
MAKGEFRGGGYGGMNQAQMMKQAQKMQQELLKMQQELEQAEYSAAAGGGAVTATVSGKRELTALKIDPETLDPEDVEMLEDMVIAAVNEALRKAEDSANQNMSKLTGGLNLGL